MVSKRISALLEMTEYVDCLCDIGSDHGIYCEQVLNRKKCNFLIPCDISNKSLSKTMKRLKLMKFPPSKYSCILSDGIINIPLEFFINATCISGLGGHEICRIISNSIARFIRMDYILIQPMQNIEYIRYWLCNNKFSFIDEKICEENNKFFHIIKAKYTGDRNILSVLDANVGKINLNRRDKSTLAYLSHLYSRKQFELSHKRRADSDAMEIIRLEILIEGLEMVLKNEL